MKTFTTFREDLASGRPAKKPVSSNLLKQRAKENEKALATGFMKLTPKERAKESKRLGEEEMKPHKMFKGDKVVVAKNKEEHDKLNKQGYTHDDPKTKKIEEAKEMCSCDCPCGKAICESCGKPHKPEDIKEATAAEVLKKRYSSDHPDDNPHNQKRIKSPDGSKMKTYKFHPGAKVTDGGEWSKKGKMKALKKQIKRRPEQYGVTEENLDEISKGLASRYIKKAVGSAITQADKTQYHTSKALATDDKKERGKHRKQGEKASRKTMNRFHGINRAAGKLDPKKSEGQYLGNKNSVKMGNAKKTFDQMQSSKVKATNESEMYDNMKKLADLKTQKRKQQQAAGAANLQKKIDKGVSFVKKKLGLKEVLESKKPVVHFKGKDSLKTVKIKYNKPIKTKVTDIGPGGKETVRKDWSEEQERIVNNLQELSPKTMSSYQKKAGKQYRDLKKSTPSRQGIENAYHQGYTTDKEYFKQHDDRDKLQKRGKGLSMSKGKGLKKEQKRVVESLNKLMTKGIKQEIDKEIKKSQKKRLTK